MQLINIAFEDLKLVNRQRKVYLEIEELAQSIQQNGLLQPLIVNNRNEILVGGRRYHAFKLLHEQGNHQDEIPCILYENTSQTDSLCIELLENLQRMDFTWQEQVKMVERVHVALTDENGSTWTMELTASRLGMSKSAVSKDLKIARDMTINPAIASADTKSKASFMVQNAMRRLESVSNVASLSDSDMAKLKAIVNCQTAKCGVQPDMNELQLGDMCTMTEENDRLLGGRAKAVTVPPVAPQTPRTGTPNDSTPHYAPEEEDAADENVVVYSAPELYNPVIPQMSYHIKDYRELLESIPDSSIGLIELDPPYAIDFDKTYGKSQGLNSTLVDWDVPKFKEEMSFLIPEAYRILIPNSWCLIWTAYEHLAWLEKEIKKTKFFVQRPGVWVKPTGTGNHPKKRMLSNLEFFLLLGKGDPAFMTSFMLQGIIQKTSLASEKVHTTEKPVALYDELFQALGRPNSLFFTAFAGSGNSLIAAAKRGMSGLGCDTDPQYKTFFEGKIVKEFFNGNK